MRQKFSAVILGVVLPCFLASSAFAQVEAITRPSGDATLAFVQPGKVHKVLVKDGDYVEPDQALIQLDDAAERQLVAQLKAEAENVVRIEAAKAQLDQRKLDLKKTELAAEKDAATLMELEHARLEVLIAELSLRLAEFQHEQDHRKYDEVRHRVDRMVMKSPLAGRIERVLLQDGEAADALEKVVRVVRIDPLWIDAPVPVTLAERLKHDQPVRVAFRNGGGVVEGKVTFISAVADAASDTLIVRVEVPNPNGRPAGERVGILFTDEAEAATLVPAVGE